MNRFERTRDDDFVLERLVGVLGFEFRLAFTGVVSVEEGNIMVDSSVKLVSRVLLNSERTYCSENPSSTGSSLRFPMLPVASTDRP